MSSVYNYDTLETDLTNFHRLYPKVPVFSVGESHQGRKIYALKLGGGGKRLFFNGAHHGMEWLTSKLLVQFSFDMASGLYGATDLLGNCSLYIVPMVNPDGVEIASSGKEWQANARGVDLNHNYDANWHLSKQAEKELGIVGPGPTRFSGDFPESEPETRAIANFTRENSFDLVLAFHSQGEVIYWDFCGFAPDKSFAIGKRFETVSPYRLDIPSGMASYGGYKDWFIKTFKKPGFTIEIGLGENPLPIESFSEIYKRTLPLMLEALKI